MWWIVLLVGCAEMGLVEWGESAQPSVPNAVACSDAFVTNTRHSVAEGTLVVDRFWRDGPRVTEVLFIEQVTAIHADEGVSTKGEAPCWTVHVALTDGRRELWLDSSDEDLTERARALAEAIGRPLVVQAESLELADAVADRSGQSPSAPKAP